MSYANEPSDIERASYLQSGTFFFHGLEDHIDDAAEASAYLEKWIRKDRLSLGLDPCDDSVGLEDHRICEMVSARMYLDRLRSTLIDFERYWVLFADRIPQSLPEGRKAG